MKRVHHALVLAVVMLLWGLAGTAGAQLAETDIDALRSRGVAEGWTFTVGPNGATDRSLEELTGFKPDPASMVAPNRKIFDVQVDDLPTSYNDLIPFLPPIRNQGACGACWAFATVGVLEMKVLQTGGPVTDYSEQWLLDCNQDGWSCEGGRWAHDYHQGLLRDQCDGFGPVLESELPYQGQQTLCECPYAHEAPIQSWSYVGEPPTPSVEQIKAAILEHGAVAVAVYVGPAFQAYTGGIFNEDEAPDPFQVNHAVVLFGWDDADKVWYLRNSWGPNWGEGGGYMRIVYGTSNIGFEANFVEYSYREQPVFNNLDKALDYGTTDTWNTAGFDTDGAPLVDETGEPLTDEFGFPLGHWLAQDLDSFDGEDAARVPSTLREEQLAVLWTTVTEPVALSFYWRVAGQRDTDYLEFWVDDELLDEITGETPWAARSYDLNLTAGEVHMLAWIFRKQRASFPKPPLRTAWLDQVKIVGLLDIAEAVDFGKSGDFLLDRAGDWFGQGFETWDGEDAARSRRNMGNLEASTMRLPVAGPATVRFYWRVSSQGSPTALKDILVFAIDEVAQDIISGETEWEEQVYELGAGDHVLIWSYQKDAFQSAGLDAGFVDRIVVSRDVTLPEALDFGDASTWLTSGDGTWTGQTGYTIDGEDAALSPVLGPSQSATLRTDVVWGPAMISFDWATSCEQLRAGRGDALRFYIDGSLRAEISGVSQSSLTDVFLDEGPHRLEWVYSKDSAVSEGLDRGWVDNFTVRGLNSDTIRVVEPAQGRQVRWLDSLLPVEWNGDPALIGSAVFLELWRNERFYRDLGASFAESGRSSFTLPLPVDIDPGGGYRVRAVSAFQVFSGLTQQDWDVSDGPFTIEGAVNILSPSTTSLLVEPGGLFPVRWSYDPIAGSAVRFMLVQDDEPVADLGFGWLPQSEGVSMVRFPAVEDLPPGGDFYLDAISVVNPRLRDRSDVTIGPLLVRAPDGVRSIFPDADLFVEWASAQATGDILRLELRQGALPVEPLGFTRDGEFEASRAFSFPADLLSGGYRVRASSILEPTVFDESRSSFGPMSIVSPNGGEQIVIGGTVPIRYVSAVNGNELSFELWRRVQTGDTVEEFKVADLLTVDQIFTGDTINAALPPIDSLDPNLRFGGGFYLRAKLDLGSFLDPITDMSDGTFEIAATFVSRPRAGAVWQIGQPAEIKWRNSLGVAGTVARLELWRYDQKVSEFGNFFSWRGEDIVSVQVPAVEPGPGYRVRAVSTYLESQAVEWSYNESGEFSIEQ